MFTFVPTSYLESWPMLLHVHVCTHQLLGVLTNATTCSRMQCGMPSFSHWRLTRHYSGVIMSAMACQITGVSIVCSTVCSGADQRTHQSSASLGFVRGIHRWPVDSPHKGPVTWKMFSFDDIIMTIYRDRLLQFKLNIYLNSDITYLLLLLSLGSVTDTLYENTRGVVGFIYD